MLPAENLLATATSPYLRQHAGNPVHWRQWNREAFAEARERDRPILLSIGYAACHWCHVMAHESFEDQATAALMNRLFINIKVDREERPEIDQVYMAALSAMGEQGGWPLTMFLTPDGHPFWGGTYFPREPRYGQPALAQVLKAIDATWAEKREELIQSGARLHHHVAAALSVSATGRELSLSHFRDFTDRLIGLVDFDKGGIRGAPKFPNAPFMNALWLRWLTDGEPSFRDAVVVSLRQMLSGGIYDHVGGGLSRYSTDPDWRVPHFEKMLYDNAQLLRLANLAYAETGEKLFRRRIEETASWLLDAMTTSNGAFVSSYDADSDAGEGDYYLWTESEVRGVLGEDTERFLTYFVLSEPPGWDGRPILHRRVAELAGDAEDEFVADALTRLRLERQRRVLPARDDKVLTDWNGLAIQALAEVGRALDRPEWTGAAVRAFRCITESMSGGRLPHSVLDGRKLFPALSSDYAAMINAALSLYQSTWQRAYLSSAASLHEALESWHGDDDGTGYYLTASDASDVPFRIRGDSDEAIPSATAQIIEALARLASATGDSRLRDKAHKVAEAAMGRIETQPYGQAGILTAAAMLQQPMKLVLATDGTAGERLVTVANQRPDPRRVDVLAASAEELKQADLLIPQDQLGGAAAYLCRGPVCLPPITDVRRLEEALRP